jgi:hypothetical protein
MHVSKAYLTIPSQAVALYDGSLAFDGTSASEKNVSSTFTRPLFFFSRIH